MNHMNDSRALRAAVMLPWLVPLAAVATMCAPPAAASPVDYYAAENAVRVCTVLDSFPTFAGIGGISDAIVANTNLSYFDAGQVIGMSVYAVCPQHIGLIEDYVATYAGLSAHPVGETVLR